MTEWAQSNFTDAEQTAFNKAIRNQDVEIVKLAIAGLAARYSTTANREPALIGGKTSKGPSDKFEDMAQVTAAINNPEYATSEAYRQKVAAKLARSSVM